MKKADLRGLIAFVLLLPVLFMSGCVTRTSPRSVYAPLTDKDNIETSQSVNFAWGGKMCEFGGFIYYCAENPNTSQCVMRMRPDGSNKESFSDNYESIYSLTIDNEALYILTEDALHSMPLSGGAARKIADGNFYDLQIYDGKIYCTTADEYNEDGELVNEKTILLRMNPDGTEQEKLIFPLESYRFLATENGLYFVSGEYERQNIYKSDLNGKNIGRVTKKNYESIDQIFYEQGSLYFLVPNDASGGFADNLDFTDRVYKIDANGKQSTVLQSIGFFEQDYGTVAYCGVTGDDFYHFEFTENGSVGEMDLHRYNMKNKTDAVILKRVQMIEPPPTVLRSARGKEIDTKGAYGFYILGNDIYFLPPELP